MQLLKYIPLQLLLCLVIGILIGFYVNISFLTVCVVLISSLAILTLIFLLIRNRLSLISLYTCSTFCVFICIGIAIVTIHNDLKRTDHYMNFSSAKNDLQIVAKITSHLKPNSYFNKYEAKVLKIEGKPSQGLVLLNIKKEHLKRQISVDDEIVVYSHLLDIDRPKNPYQFDYKNYLKRQHIYKQITIANDEFIKLEGQKSTFNGLAYKFRERTNEILIKNGFIGDELAIVNALLLGQRQQISNELLQSYANAGAIHILAISGLHVGIIMLLLNFILKPLRRLKNGNIIRLICVVLLLWLFAFVAGMSASVIRAVTMFTAVSIGLAIRRKNSVYKNLIISMFFLLLFHPYYLFEVGFQLSYLGVFFIVWLQPIIYNIWNPTLKFIDYFWQLFTVSLAAQIGVLPLSLYYFHQFPGLFFAANLAIVPILGFVLGLGIIIIFLSWIQLTPILLLSLFKEIISTMNRLISWIAGQKSFLFQEISFSIFLVLGSYLFLILTVRWIQKKTLGRLKFALLSLIFLQGIFLFQKYESAALNEFIIFNKSKNSLIAVKERNTLTVLKKTDVQTSNIISDYTTGRAIDNLTETDHYSSIYTINDKNILVVDSLSVYKPFSFKVDKVLLINSPKINLERLIEELSPSIIIADASNYKSYAARWQQTCSKRRIAFHYTVRDGAYIEEW